MAAPDSANPDLLAKALTIFRGALGDDVGNRDAFVAEACAGQQSLLDAVQELLRAHDDTRAGFATQDVQAAIQSQHVSLEGIEGTHVGGYRLLDRAGSGGMGVVYRAEQESPKRQVALKIMRLEMDQDALRHRFQREVQVLAQLQHPGIAQIYDTGVMDFGWGDVPFFAMEFIHGEAIDDFVRKRSLGARDSCELMTQICDAVQHAHQRGVVHRDLKPDNILVTELDDTTARTKILDFGIAQTTQDNVLSGTQANTLTGQLLGTLNYMSPERTNGDRESDHRSDIYSLGVILFELLTQKLPLDLNGRSFAEVAQILAHDEPTRLGHHDTSLRGDLEVIVAKALARDTDRRYPSAAELGDDLRRYLANQPIHARPLSAWYFLRKSIARHRGLAVGVSATILTLAAGLITAMVLAEKNEVLASNERTQRHSAERARDDYRETLYRAEMRFVAGALANPRGRERARNLIRNWQPQPGLPDPREFEWRLGQRMTFTEDLVVPECRDTELIWSEDGIQFVHEMEFVKVDPESGEVTKKPRTLRGGQWTLRTAGDRDRYVTGVRQAIGVSSFDHGGETLIKTGWVNDARISPDGRFVAAAVEDEGRHWLEFYDLDSERFVHRDLPRRFPSRGFEFSPDSTQLASAQQPGRLQIWSCHDERPVREIAINDGQPFCIAWSRDGARLAIGFEDGRIDLVDLATGDTIRSCTGHAGRVMSMSWSRDASRLLSGSKDSTVRIWETATGASRILGAHHGTCARVAWSPDERFVASSGSLGTLRTYPADAVAGVRHMPGLANVAATSVTWSGDGKSMLVDHAGGTTIVDPVTGRRLEAHDNGIMRRSHSGRYYVAAAGAGWQVRATDDDGHLATLPELHRTIVRWHPTDDAVLLAGVEGCWTWSADHGLEQLPNLPNTHQVDWHRQSRRVVGLSSSTLSFIAERGSTDWNVARIGHPGDPRAWASAPHNNCFAMDHANMEVEIYEHDSGKLLQRLVGHSHAPTSIAWNPAGTRIATADTGGFLRLWHPESAEEVFFVQLEGRLANLAWAPDGDRLAVIAAGKVIVLDARDAD